jgi:hypothetical protein
MSFAHDGDQRSHARLSTFLAGEAAAIALYHRVIDRFPDEPQLSHCLHEHQVRHRTLERLLHRQGGRAGDVTGEHPFALCSDVALDGCVDTALACLAECEATFAEDYRAYLCDLDPEARDLVRGDLLIAQRQTVHELTTRLRHSLF